MCGGGNGGPIPTPQEERCPKQIVVEITDVLHSGNKEIWDNKVKNHSVLNLKPSKDDNTIILLFDGKHVGRIYNQLIYKCMTKKGKNYIAVVIDKLAHNVRLINKE